MTILNYHLHTWTSQISMPVFAGALECSLMAPSVINFLGNEMAHYAANSTSISSRIGRISTRLFNPHPLSAQNPPVLTSTSTILNFVKKTPSATTIWNPQSSSHGKAMNQTMTDSVLHPLLPPRPQKRCLATNSAPSQTTLSTTRHLQGHT